MERDVTGYVRLRRLYPLGTDGTGDSNGARTPVPERVALLQAPRCRESPGRGLNPPKKHSVPPADVASWTRRRPARKLSPPTLATRSMRASPRGLPPRGRTDFVTIRKDDVFLHLAFIAFDASTWEIWGTLLNGGRLVIAPPTDLSPKDISSLVHGNGVTVLLLTTGLFHVMTEEGLAHLRGLRYLLVGGDVLSVKHVNHALREPPATTLINAYGPTENTTITTCHTITGPVHGPRVPIGRPIRERRCISPTRNWRPCRTGR